ncbi:hypothetical protein ACHAW6_007411 [Cyclotella cf. meneghiniana]
MADLPKNDEMAFSRSRNGRKFSRAIVKPATCMVSVLIFLNQNMNSYVGSDSFPLSISPGFIDECVNLTEFCFDSTKNRSDSQKDALKTLNVTIRMRRARTDRLGSNIYRPLFLYAYSTCMGYNFCIMEGREGLAKWFNFPTCPSDLDNYSPSVGQLFEDQVNQSGTYEFGSNAQNQDEKKLSNAIKHMSEDCLFPSFLRRRWSEMIMQAAQHPDLNSTLANEIFFSNQTSTKVAVHIRRGDFTAWGMRCVWDDIYVQLIKKLRLGLMLMEKVPEVHIFSENYGMIDTKHNISANWSLYEGLADRIHLAPEQGGAGDIAMHIRDWRHFLLADILVVGSTFSRMPSFGRDPSSKLTVLQEYSKVNPWYSYGWTNYSDGSWRMDRLEVHNLPPEWSAVLSSDSSM